MERDILSGAADYINEIGNHGSKWQYARTVDQCRAVCKNQAAILQNVLYPWKQY